MKLGARGLVIGLLIGWCVNQVTASEQSETVVPCQDAKDCVQRGTLFFENGEHDRAIADFTQAITLNPMYAEAYYHRGLAYGQTGTVDRSMLDIKKACELGLEHVCVMLNMLSLFSGNPVMRIYLMQASSMEPTIMQHEKVLVDQEWYQHHAPQRGDIAVLRYPDNRSRSFLKRIIGLPGETLEIHNKRVSINGERLEESYIQHKTNEMLLAKYSPRDNLSPLLIPEDSVFVLGDDRDASLDSRFFKKRFVPCDDLQGKVLSIYWSPHEERVGLSLQ